VVNVPIAVNAEVKIATVEEELVEVLDVLTIPQTAATAIATSLSAITHNPVHDRVR
jgi:hypothetical protein